MLFGFKAMKINHILLNPFLQKAIDLLLYSNFPLHENKHNQHHTHIIIIFLIKKSITNLLKLLQRFGKIKVQPLIFTLFFSSRTTRAMGGCDESDK